MNGKNNSCIGFPRVRIDSSERALVPAHRPQTIVITIVATAPRTNSNTPNTHNQNTEEEDVGCRSK